MMYYITVQYDGDGYSMQVPQQQCCFVLRDEVREALCFRAIGRLDLDLHDGWAGFHASHALSQEHMIRLRAEDGSGLAKSPVQCVFGCRSRRGGRTSANPSS